MAAKWRKETPSGKNFSHGLQRSNLFRSRSQSLEQIREVNPKDSGGNRGKMEGIVQAWQIETCLLPLKRTKKPTRFTPHRSVHLVSPRKSWPLMNISGSTIPKIDGGHTSRVLSLRFDIFRIMAQTEGNPSRWRFENHEAGPQSNTQKFYTQDPPRT